MTGIIVLCSFYAIVFIGGHWAARLMPNRTIFGHILLTLTFAAVNLLGSIQILSLFHSLKPLQLFSVNTAIAGCAFILNQKAGHGVGLDDLFRSFKYLLNGLRSRPVISIALSVTMVWCASGFIATPNTDSYHFAMPLFWRQNETILPFHVSNPRIVSVVFASEAICLPGVLFADSIAAFSTITWLAVVLSACVIVSLSKKLGASKAGAYCAGVAFLACSTTAISTLGGSPDIVLSAFWFGVSVHFLFSYNAKTERAHWYLGCSAMCFTLACSAKNLAFLQAPTYFAAILIWCGAKTTNKRILVQILAGGVVGLILTGLLWNQLLNIIWFGSPKGHMVLQDTIAQDWNISAIWTRIVRAGVWAIADPIWLPGKLHEYYQQIILGITRVLGAQDVLAEDDSYYHFSKNVIAPNRGLGWIGITVLAPTIIFIIIKMMKCGSGAIFQRNEYRQRFALCIVAVGSILTTYAALRTQSIGISRLMLSSILPIFPLSGLMLSHRCVRVAIIPVISGCLIAYTTLGLAQVARHAGGSLAPLAERFIFRPERSHGKVLEYRWSDGTTFRKKVGAFRWGYAFAPLFDRLDKPVTVGYVWHTNAEEYFLFGPLLKNRVYALTDSRAPTQLNPANPEIEFIVVADVSNVVTDTALALAYPSYELWLEVDSNATPLYKVLRRKTSLQEAPLKT